MQLHFYTTYEFVQMLREGDDIVVWTKDGANPYDIHVSLNMDEYSFHQISDVCYKVWLKQ